MKTSCTWPELQTFSFTVMAFRNLSSSFNPFARNTRFNSVSKCLYRSLSSLPLTISPGSNELASNSLSWRNLQIATRALHRDGLVVVEDVLDHAVLDKLNEKMIADSCVLQSAGDESPYNYNKGFARTTEVYFSN